MNSTNLEVKSRLYEELKDLNAKITRLNSIFSEKYLDIPVEQLNLLMEQHIYMVKYQNILVKRVLEMN